MTVLHELGGFDLSTAWRVVGDLAKKKHAAIELFEKQFLQAAVDLGHEYGRAWSAFDEIRHAGMRALACKAHHVAHAVTTFRALWLKIHHNRVYRLYAPPEVDSQQVE